LAKKVEIVSVGNELLIGKTLNTNAQWLAKRTTSVGLLVSRITVVGDDVAEISKAVQEAVHRSPDFILMTGGLGPTFDDKTLEGIAEAFDCKLRVDEKALRMVKEKYVKYAAETGRRRIELTTPRVKMARLPELAEPIPNPVGTAPGIILRKGNTSLFALPGVPLEMKAIFEETLLPIFKDLAGGLTFFETSLYVTGVMESEIAPIIDRVMHDNPFVYVKSHPMGAEQKPIIELHFSTMAGDAKIAKKRLPKALLQLTNAVKVVGGKTEIAKAENAVKREA
jgi:molybdenum cofactor synthesis domain-containing protein